MSLSRECTLLGGELGGGLSDGTVLGHEGLVDGSYTPRTVTRVDRRADPDVMIFIVFGLGHCSQEDLM